MNRARTEPIRFRLARRPHDAAEAENRNEQETHDSGKRTPCLQVQQLSRELDRQMGWARRNPRAIGLRHSFSSDLSNGPKRR